MKGVYDKRKIPRETLAYLIDSTGSPVCVLIPFSSWAVYFGSIFFSQDSVQALGCSTWLEAYVKAIPFCIYPIVTLIILFLFSFGFFPKLGKMKEAYERVEKTGMVYGESSRKYNLNEESGEDGNIWDFIVPMAVLVIVAVATGNLVVSAGRHPSCNPCFLSG